MRLATSLGLLASLSLLLPCLATARPALSHQDVIWLRRASFGIDTATLTRFQQLGRSAFIAQALRNRSNALPPPIQQQLDSYRAINTAPAELFVDYRQQAQKIKAMPDGDAKVDAKKALQKSSRALLHEAQQAELLRAIYGANPLREQMVWFWLNHFSIYGNKGPVKLFAADYEEHVIRPHALGHFRDLVMATLESPAMLEFLDNAHNVKGKTNENYARELMELHTLGVGSGYTQNDVQALMAVLTGVGVTPPGQLEREQRGRGPRLRPTDFIQRGLFTFNPARHDFTDKTFLGHTIKGSGFDEVRQAVDLIVRQPACARFISRQLATYFVADQPPPSLVGAMARTFTRTDGDIAAVLRTMFQSPQLDTSLGHKFSDPMQFVVAAERFTLDGRPIRNVEPLARALQRLGEPLDGRITPDGWPLEGASWSGSGQLADRFGVAKQIGSGSLPLSIPLPPESTSRPTPSPAMMAMDNGHPLPSLRPRPNPPNLQTPLFAQAFEPWLPPATKAALAHARSPQEWNTFLLASPEFNYR